MRRLPALALLFTAPLLLVAQPPVAVPSEQVGFLDQPSFEIDRARRGPSRPYLPQPGDILFSTTDAVILKTGHFIAGAGAPHHSAIFFRRPDGQMAVLEAGPHDNGWIETLDPLSHLSSYEELGRVWVRPRAAPLTEEQSCRLTEFALKTEGKRFAFVRIWRQITPIRERGPVRTYFMGQVKGPDKSRYYCAELVAEALVYAGTVPAEDSRPRAMYPSDFFHDRSMNLFLNKHYKLGERCWDVPARWTSCPQP